MTQFTKMKHFIELAHLITHTELYTRGVIYLIIPYSFWLHLKLCASSIKQKVLLCTGFKQQDQICPL